MLDHILESSLNFQSLFGALYTIYQLSEIKDDIQVVSQFPCLLGHPVIKLRLLIILNFLCYSHVNKWIIHFLLFMSFCRAHGKCSSNLHPFLLYTNNFNNISSTSLLFSFFPPLISSILIFLFSPSQLSFLCFLFVMNLLFSNMFLCSAYHLKQSWSARSWLMNCIWVYNSF